jgi:hypothetical protein
MGYADQCVGGERNADIFSEMVVEVLAADSRVVSFFDNELDIQQTGKGYFFTCLQVVEHSEVILRVTKGA